MAASEYDSLFLVGKKQYVKSVECPNSQYPLNNRQKVHRQPASSTKIEDTLLSNKSTGEY